MNQRTEEHRSTGPTSVGLKTELKLDDLAQWIHEARCVVWFTGAGISTESGLPDFRGPDGVWTRWDKGLPPPSQPKRAEEIEPNPAHLAIVEFERIGKCDFLVSQNVDNLHLRSGYPIDKLAELHGNSNRIRCRPCGKTFVAQDVPKRTGSRRKTRDGRFAKACPMCGGALENSVINFGDAMPTEDLDAAFEWADSAELIIVVGSSCRVVPAAQVPMATKNHGGKLVVMNIGETALDKVCDLRFGKEKVGKLLPKLLDKVQALQNSRSE